MKSENFEFLRARREVLADLAGFAEHYAREDSASSLIKQRSFVELAVAPTVEQRTFEVPKEQWLAMLKRVGHCDSIFTELWPPTNGPESTSVGRQRVVKAVNARNDGCYRNTVQECSVALDALKTAGFGGRLPDEVAMFLQKNARNLSQAERFSALQIAMRRFLSPAHHDGVPDEEFSREDADLAIAMTAALLRLAPRWVADSTEAGASKESTS